MKKVIRTKHVLVMAIVGVILFIGIVGAANAQDGVWTSNGPYGGYICDIAISSDYASDQTVFIAAGTKGAYKSTDSGNSWIQVIAPTDYILAIAVSPNYASDKTVFAGAYKSIDGGDSWTETGAPINNIISFAISPNYAVDETIFVGSYWNQGIAKSSDGGVTWTLNNSDFANLNNYGLAISPNYASDGTIFAGQGDGVYKSTDGGDTWKRVLTESDYPEALVVSPNYAEDQTIFVGFRNEPTYKSTDGGTTWTPVGLKGTVSLAISPVFSSDQTIFAGNVKGGVSKSTDEGITWTEVSNGLAMSWVQSLAISPIFSGDPTLFAGLGRNFDGPGIYKSTNGADSWTEANTGLNIGRTITSIAISPNYANDQTVFASSTEYESHVFKSMNGGGSWEMQGSMAGNTAGGVLGISPDYVNDQTIFAAGRHYSAYKSTNGGDTWAEVNDGLPSVGCLWEFAVSPNFANDGTVFLCSYKSTNGGLSWETTGLATTALAISPNYQEDDTIFGATTKGVYKSTDGGGTCTQVNNGLEISEYSSSGVMDLVISPNYATDQTIFAAVHHTGIYRSTNGGANWTLVYDDPYFFPRQSLAISPNYKEDCTLLVAASFSSPSWGGIAISQDCGDTWSRIGGNSMGILALVVSPNFAVNHRIFVGNFDGVWTTTITTNTPPTADDQSVVTDEDTPLTITLTASDVDNDPLTCSIMTPPAHGTLSGTTPDLTYTPDADYNGPDNFTFKANDGTLDSNEATVTITVNPVNDAPEALADGPFIGFEDSPVSMDASASDDPEGVSLTFNWNFGDGSTLVTTESIIKHTYKSAGTYTVTLVVNDGELDSTTFTTEANIASTGGGGRDDVDAFLAYVNPLEKSTDLPVGTTSFDVQIIYGPAIDPATFEASLNKEPFAGFNPVAGTSETVNISLSTGRNTLILKVDGMRSDGRTATDRDRLVFIVK